MGSTDTTDKTVKLKPFILLALIGGALALMVVATLAAALWYRNVSRKDYVSLSSQLHRKLDDRLSELGLGPEHKLSERRFLRRSGDVRWLFKEAKVSVPPEKSIYRTSLLLAEAARKSGSSANIEIERYGLDGAIEQDTLVQIELKKLPVYRLFLVRTGFPPPDRTPSVEEGAPKIAIIIDDLGWKLEPAEKLLLIDEPITLAIIPKLGYSTEIANRSIEKGGEVLVHIPMEPHPPAVIAPKDGGVTLSMSDWDIRRTVAEDLDSLPQAVGLNNHMGSKFTESQDKMRLVLGEAKRRKLYFIDSRTSPHSVAYSAAAELGIEAGSRDVFLDHEVGDIDYTKGQIVKLMEIAKEYGSAIGIGHPNASTIDALVEMIPRMKKEGFKLVFASELVSRSNNNSPRTVSYGAESRLR